MTWKIYTHPPLFHFTKAVHNTKIQKAKSAEQQEQVHQMIYRLVHKREKVVLKVKMDTNYHCKVNVCEVGMGVRKKLRYLYSDRITASWILG